MGIFDTTENEAMDLTPDGINAAFHELDALARKLAPPHYPESNLPEDPDEMWAFLQEWMWGDASSRVRSLPVWDGGCDLTIYPAPEGNHAFRAWHDSLHLATGHRFDAVGERHVAVAHVRLARAHGCSQVAQAAIWADTWGQFLYGEAHDGAFVEDQRAFVIACLQGRSAASACTHRAIEEVIASGERF
jgi:hypothetical protein